MILNIKKLLLVTFLFINIYSLIPDMKILSSFDTNLKKEYIKDFTRQYSQEKIVVITRSVLYFLKKVMSNILRGILIYIVLIGSSYFLIGMDKTVQYGIWIALPFALVFFIIALENYIDYSMNFAIFTPDEALLVEQL